MSAYIKSFRLELTGSAQALSSVKLFTPSFAIRNEVGNADIYVGDSTVSSTTGMFIQAGEVNEKSGRATTRGSEIVFDLKLIYIIGTAGQFVRVEYLADE